MLKIVFLDAGTIGKNISLDDIKSLGELILYRTTSPEEVNSRIAGCDVVITNKVKILSPNIDATPSLKLICIAATGVNNVDVEYATSKGIPVKNVAGYSTESVAQVTIMHILNLVGHGIYYNDFVHSGQYTESGFPTDVSHPFFELKGKRLGIIAMGHIGTRVAQLATAFGMKVSYYSTSGTSHCTLYPSLPIDELLSTSDIVSVNAPLNAATSDLITYSKLKLMKPSAYIVNVGRGGIVNEEDLVKALNEHLIMGAAIDVYQKEPIALSHPYLSKLQDPSSLILSPHIAWTSDEAQVELIHRIAENISSIIK